MLPMGMPAGALGFWKGSTEPEPPLNEFPVACSCQEQRASRLNLSPTVCERNLQRHSNPGYRDAFPGAGPRPSSQLGPAL
ncbi:unnamed protein product [Gadus morhua 'NCC']